MDRWEQPQLRPPRPQAPPHHRHGRNNPSFSSSLLDAICRHLDDSDTARNDKNQSLPPPPQPTLRRRNLDPSDDPRHRRFLSETCSTYGKFSSSDFDPATRPRPILTRSNLIRIDPPPPPEKRRSGRSPGARLAAFVNAIFAGGEAKTSNKGKFVGRGKQEPVRISPVSVEIAVEKRPASRCGDGDRAARRNLPESVELVRGFEKIDEEDCESVSSSDLFELDGVSAIGRFTHKPW